MYLRVLTCLGCTPSAATAPIRASNPSVGMKLHAGGMGQNSVFSHVFAAKSRVEIGIEVCKAILFHSRCNYGLYATWVAPLVPNQAETPDLALFLEPRTCYTPATRPIFRTRSSLSELGTYVTNVPSLRRQSGRSQCLSQGIESGLTPVGQGPCCVHCNVDPWRDGKADSFPVHLTH